MNALDWLVVGNAFFSLSVFVLCHILIFRFTKHAAVLKWVKRFFMIGLAVNLIGYSVYPFGGFVSTSMTKPPYPCFIEENTFTFPLKLLGLLLSVFIYGVSAFLYVLCVLGPYESSIRLRLIRELSFAGLKGLTTKEILQRYNAMMIIQRRLDRLVASGELRREGSFYRSGKSQNVFLLIEMMAGFLARCIGEKGK